MACPSPSTSHAGLFSQLGSPLWRDAASLKLAWQLWDCTGLNRQGAASVCPVIPAFWRCSPELKQ